MGRRLAPPTVWAPAAAADTAWVTLLHPFFFLVSSQGSTIRRHRHRCPGAVAVAAWAATGG
jgi:hypothetical protein